MNDDDLLIGWRGVATYFHRSEKTLRRWHRKYELPIVKIGRSIYCSKIGIAFTFERIAAYQRARWGLAAVAARKAAPPEMLNDVQRAQMGAMLRAKLAEQVHTVARGAS